MMTKTFENVGDICFENFFNSRYYNRKTKMALLGVKNFKYFQYKKKYNIVINELKQLK